MTGTIRPFDKSIRTVEAENLAVSDRPKLYVMPAPLDRPEGGVRFAAQSGKLLDMPSRWGSSFGRTRSRRLYRNNAVECWPKGYPAYDDL